MAIYLIEFDTLPGHTPGTGATLPAEVLNLVGWRSIGNPQGGRFINRTGGTIRSIYLKCSDSTNSFQITATSGGRLFPTIWVKSRTDGTISEVYFMDGNIPNLVGAFWMRVPRNTVQEIQNCDGQQACPFSGQVFEQNPAIPAGGGWTRIDAQPSPSNAVLKELLAATPAEYRAIDAHAQSGDGQRLLFVSCGEILLYDKLRKTVALYVPPKVATTPPVDAIRFDAATSTFQLLNKGVVVRIVPDDSTSLHEIGRAS